MQQITAQSIKKALYILNDLLEQLIQKEILMYVKD